jgi:hypothetical protein
MSRVQDGLSEAKSIIAQRLGDAFRFALAILRF